MKMIMMVMMMVMMMMMMINSDRTEKRISILTLSPLRRKLSPTRTLKRPSQVVCKSRATHQLSLAKRNRLQMTCNTSSFHHVQHVVCLVVQRDSSDIKLDRAEIAFTLALFYWLKSSTDEGGEETEVPRENP